MDNVIAVSPFQIGWKVSIPTRSAKTRETVTGRREVALELAAYYARRHRRPRVVVYSENGAIEETIGVTA